MTVSTATSRNSYNGNAATDTFAYTFRILDEAHVAVYVDDVLQTITTHYTVTGVGDAGGGDIVFTTPPATGTLNVVFIRSVPVTQETDYVENDPFPAAAHEDALDKLTMLVQQTDEKHSRTPKFAVTSSTSDITFPEPSADEVIGWNAAGDDLENKTLSAIGAIVLPVSISDGGTGQTTASAAISALGGVAKAGDSMTGLLRLIKGADITAAATTDLGTATGNTVDVTHSSGTLAITSLGGASLPAGTEIETRYVISGGTLSLTHHATNLYLAGGVDITLANGDVIRWRKMHSSNAEWKMVGGFSNAALTNAAQTFTASQRGTLTTDNDLSFDQSVTNNFFCTPSGTGTLTFTNHTSGQSGFILLANTGGYAISAAATTKVDGNFLATVSTAGTYLLSYLSNGTNTYVVTSGDLA